MGSCCCKKEIKIVNKFPKEEKFGCTRPSGKIILSYDEQFEVPRFEIKFDGFYETAMKILKKREQFLLAHFPLLAVPTISLRLSFLRHFHCHCNVEHKTFVITCQGHPTLYLLLDDMVQKCYCKSAGLYKLCSSCVAKRYVLNFRAIKFCMREIPSYLKNVAVDFNYFLKVKSSCEPFFIFKGNTVVSSLDNPRYDLMNNNKRPAN